jgi:heme A synthase
MKDLGPILLGLCGAVVIIGGRWVLRRALTREPHRRSKHVVFFALMFLMATAGAAFIRDEAFLRIALGVISLIFLWASVGSALQWPGFRDPPPQNEDSEMADA